ALYTGQWEHARQLLENGATAMREAGARVHLCHYLFWLARVELAHGKLKRAEGFLREGLELACSAGAALFEMLFRPDLASVYVQIYRAGEAKDHLDRCAEILSLGENWYGLAGHVARAHGEFAASQENWNVGARFLEQATTIFREQRMPWEEALACEAWAKAAAGQGYRGAARLRINATLAIYRDLGAGEAWIDRAKAIAKAIGATTDPTEPEASSSTRGSLRRKRKNSAWVHTDGGNPTPPEAEKTVNGPEMESDFRREGEFWTISYDNRTF